VVAKPESGAIHLADDLIPEQVLGVFIAEIFWLLLVDHFLLLF